MFDIGEQKPSQNGLGSILMLRPKAKNNLGQMLLQFILKSSVLQECYLPLQTLHLLFQYWVRALLFRLRWFVLGRIRFLCTERVVYVLCAGRVQFREVDLARIRRVARENNLLRQ